MAEKLDLTTPVTTPTVTDYRVSSLVLDWDAAHIGVFLRGTNGERRMERYDGPGATSLMTALNKANLTANSLHKRILNQLVTDGYLPAGTIAGTPD